MPARCTMARRQNAPALPGPLGCGELPAIPSERKHAPCAQGRSKAGQVRYARRLCMRYVLSAIGTLRKGRNMEGKSEAIGAAAIEGYIEHCLREKRLDEKTVRAYRCDLMQVIRWAEASGADLLDKAAIRAYVAHLNDGYAPASVKRKVASLKAFFGFLAEVGAIGSNPFSGLKLNMREPKRLPRTVPMGDLEAIYAFEGSSVGKRDEAILEMLIATGMRVSELCALDVTDCDLSARTVRISGKGSKERVVQLESEPAIRALESYLPEREGVCARTGAATAALFVNRFGHRLGDQSVRAIVSGRARDAGASVAVSPHMLRHTFATLLLESDVDIRYIQSLLGHSSIKTTEIYTHVAAAKQREVMRKHNPRNAIKAGR